MPIKLDNVCYEYAGFGQTSAVQALSSVSLSISDGEFVGITGERGCGKTTLVELMSGLLVPTHGQVFLDDEDINGKKYNRGAMRGAVGFIYNRPQRQLFETTVEREVGFTLRKLGADKEDVTARVKAALSQVGLEYDEVYARSPLSFSAGEQYLIAVAAVLAAQPRVLILDEPADIIDPAGENTLYKLLCDLNSRGTTIILVSQNTDVLAQYAQRVLIMRNGAIIRDGRTKDIFSDYYDLLHNGVTVPQVRQCVQLMRERGVDIPANMISYEQFIDRLKILMWRKTK